MRKSTKNAVAAIVAILLALAIVIVCGVGSSWFTNSDIATWFNSWGKGEQTVQPDEETPNDEQPVDEGGMQIGESSGNGISLMSSRIAPADYAEYGISPMAESAQQLTATITPANATDKTVDWTVKWKDVNSVWTKGKTVTDYVTVTPTSDGALTANVECKQAFGEQVQVVCTSRQNTEASATATVDYAKRITAINRTENSGGSVLFTMTAEGSSLSIAKEMYFLDDLSAFVPVYSVGTVDDSFSFTYTYWYSNDFVTALKSAGFTDVSSALDETELPTDSTRAYFDGIAPGCGAAGKDASGIQSDAYSGTTGLYNRYVSALQTVGNETIYTMKVVAKGKYSSFTATCAFSVDVSSFDILVQSVGGLTNLVF